MQVGDKVICIKEMNFGGGVIFKEGYSYEIIKYIDNFYYEEVLIANNDGLNIDECIICSLTRVEYYLYFYDMFITSLEDRRNKILKLKEKCLKKVTK